MPDTAVNPKDVKCIGTVYAAVVAKGDQLKAMSSALREMGHTGLTLHDPVTKELQVLYPQVNELILEMLHEADKVAHHTKYDSATRSIVLPACLTVFGQSTFSDMSLWGGCQSRKVDHNEAGAEAKYEKNLQTVRARRSMNVGPVADCSDAKFLHAHEVDRLSMKMCSCLSELSGLKEKLVSLVVLNARLDRFVEDNSQHDAVDVSKLAMMPARFHAAIQKLRMAKGGPKTMALIADVRHRSGLIEALMELDGSNKAFVVPFREIVSASTVSEDAEPTVSWKVETALNIGGAMHHSSSSDKARLDKIWSKVCSVRLWELKAPLNYSHGKQVDPATADVESYDRYTGGWKRYAVENGIAPHNYNSLKLLTREGVTARVAVPGAGVRSPNFFEYAVMSRNSVWQGSVVIVRCSPNAKDGLYYNPTSVQMVTPANFLYRLSNSDTAPKLRLPLDDVYGMVRTLLGADNSKNADAAKEAEVDMDHDYMGAPDARHVVDETDEPDAKRAKVENEDDSE
jgi:hypothetical protein